VQELLSGEAEAIARLAIDKALEGVLTALILCLDRIIPPTKDQPVDCNLPKMKTLHKYRPLWEDLELLPKNRHNQKKYLQ
jgi:hypothetical protein